MQEEMEHDVGLIFDTDDEKIDYIYSLQSQNEPVFSNINKVAVTINGIPAVQPTGLQEVLDPTDKNKQILIIVGSVTGAVLLLAVVFAFRVCKRKSDRRRAAFIQRPAGPPHVST